MKTKENPRGHDHEMTPSRILNRRNRATGATNTEARNPSHHTTPRINKKPDLPAGLLASPPEDYHAGGNRTNGRTKQRIPTNTKATASTNQPKQASARRCVPRLRRWMCCRRHHVREMRWTDAWLAAGNIRRGWDSLHEFLDSTAHYGGRQSGRVNLPVAPTRSDCRCSTTCRRSGTWRSHCGADCTRHRRCMGERPDPSVPAGMFERLRRMSTVEPASGHRHHLA